MVSDPFVSLIFMCAFLFLGSFLSGYVPLAFQFSSRKMQRFSLAGVGMLVGTSLVVIIPEGIHTIYSGAGAAARPHAFSLANRHRPSPRFVPSGSDSHFHADDAEDAAYRASPPPSPARAPEPNPNPVSFHPAEHSRSLLHFRPRPHSSHGDSQDFALADVAATEPTPSGRGHEDARTHTSAVDPSAAWAAATVPAAPVGGAEEEEDPPPRHPPRSSASALSSDLDLDFNSAPEAEAAPPLPTAAEAEEQLDGHIHGRHRTRRRSADAYGGRGPDPHPKPRRSDGDSASGASGIRSQSVAGPELEGAANELLDADVNALRSDDLFDDEDGARDADSDEGGYMRPQWLRKERAASEDSDARPKFESQSTRLPTATHRADADAEVHTPTATPTDAPIPARPRSFHVVLPSAPEAEREAEGAGASEAAGDAAGCRGSASWGSRYIGLALVLGFVFQLLVDRLSSEDGHSHGPVGPAPHARSHAHSHSHAVGTPHGGHGSSESIEMAPQSGPRERSLMSPSLSVSTGVVGPLGPPPESQSASGGALSIDCGESAEGWGAEESHPSDKPQPQPTSAVFGMRVHAAVDGIALGAASFSGSSSLELVVFFAILMHKFPHSFGMTSYLLQIGLPRSQVSKQVLIFSLCAPFAALVTYLLLARGVFDASGSQDRDDQLGLLLLFSAGSFLYVATVHVLPEIQSGSGDGRGRLDWWSTAALVVGMFMPLLFTIEHSHAHGGHATGHGDLQVHAWRGHSHS